MKKQLLLLITISICIASQAQVRYGFMTKTGSFIFGNNTSYVQTIDNLNVASISNSRAREIAGTGNIFTHKGSMYYVNFGEPRIYKFGVNTDGSLIDKGTILLPDGPSNPHIVDFKIIDDNTAYALSYGVWEVFIINTNNMTVIDRIDLNAINKPDFETSTLEEMQIRDGKLYMGIWYGSGLQNANAIDTAYVAIVDLATKKLDKVISDPRTFLLGYGSSAVDAMFIDEQGDMYISGSDFITGGSGKRPGGILRIKKGETEFDKSFFINLDQLCGNRKSLGMTYLGNGILITTAQYPEAISILNPLSKYLDPTLKYWQVDLKTKTAKEVIGSPFTRGFLFSWLTKIADNQYLLPIGGENNENSIYLYNLATNTATKKITLEGEPFGVFPLNKDATVGLRENELLAAELVLFPNPVNDEVNLSILSKVAGKTSVSILSIDGKVVFNAQIQLNIGQGLYSFPTSELPAGVYTIQVLNEQGQSSLKFVK